MEAKALSEEDLLLQSFEIEQFLLKKEMGYGDSLAKGYIPWQISPEPFFFDPGEIAQIERLGRAVLAFYRVMISIYQKETWVRQLLDIGKPPEALQYQNWPLANK